VRTECSREQDVLDALMAGRWPDRCEIELRNHITTCAVCADVVEVAAALLEERDLAWRDARVPTSGVVWWRAQVRARQEAARQAARPLTIAETMAAAVAVAVTIGLFSMVPFMAEWTGSVLQLTGGLHFPLPRVDGIAELMMQSRLLGFLVLGAFLVLGPLALYLAVARD
jgi:hypothetical protein